MMGKLVFIQRGMLAKINFLPCLPNQENPNHLPKAQIPSLNLYLLPWNDIVFSLCFLPIAGLCSLVYFSKEGLPGRSQALLGLS